MERVDEWCQSSIINPKFLLASIENAIKNIVAMYIGHDV